MSDLFAASGLAADAPRPLADRLRPVTLSDVVGQEHLTGEEGALTRMLRSGSIGSLIFWGPPGTGKTTAARLLANQTSLHFEQISAIFSGIADLKKFSRSHVAGARQGRAPCSSWMKSIDSTARNRTASCRSLRTARSH